MTSPWTTIAKLLLALAIIWLLSAIIVLAIRPQHQLHGSDSVEGVFQRYVRAVESRDTASALEYLADPSGQLCPADFGQPANVLVESRGVDITGDRAVLKVSIDQHYPETVQLERTNGAWKLLSVPWEVSLCSVEEQGVLL